jgi:hypothetical protein
VRNGPDPDTCSGSSRCNASGTCTTAILDGGVSDGGVKPDTAADTAPSFISFFPAAEDFGAVQVGNHQEFPFTLNNTGTTTTGPITVTLSGPSAGEFYIVVNGCTGASLPPESFCAVTVRFAPTSPGSKTATLSASASPGGTTSASLSGSGV